MLKWMVRALGLRSSHALAAASIALLLLGCSDAPPTTSEPPPSSQPEPPWPVLTDTDPDPAVMRVELEAVEAQVEILEGKSTPVWAYRDAGAPKGDAMVPGPLLDVEVGQRVQVHFVNRLPVETTIHWHGIRLAASMDGTPLSQMPVPPNGEFTYEFEVLDPGLYWYHPHMDSEMQIERGLYAPLRVRGGVDPIVTRERIFVLDDVKISSDGPLVEETLPMDLMMGRQGNVLLVNGRRDRTIDYATGSRERWRLVNAANGRFFNLELPSGAKFLVIGWDGGLLEQPYEAATLLLAPGERYDVLVTLEGDPGSSAALQNVHYDRGHDLPDPGPKPILDIDFVPPEAEPPPALPSTWGEVEPIQVPAGIEPRELVLTENMDETVPGAEPEFFINDEKWPDHTPLTGVLGGTELWHIDNVAEMDHPFHLHGMFFQVIERDGVPEALLGLKDTVIVPKESSVLIAVKLDAPGAWPFHCHILEHAERGMMGHIEVVP